MPRIDGSVRDRLQKGDRNYHTVYQRRWQRENPDKVRRYKLKQQYGITPEAYDIVLLRQGGKCALCGWMSPKQSRLVVDHCHETKQIRGLLCSLCNRALGKLGDNVKSIERVLAYLKGTLS